MTQRWTLEIKVGAWVILGFVLLIFFMFAIGDLSTVFERGHRLYVWFESANGITDGSPVQYAGKEVGKVVGVELITPTEQTTPPSHVQLVIRVPNSVNIRVDDEASISTFGLLGEKYLEIRPGPGMGAVIEPDGRIVGKPPVSTERIMERSNEVLTEFHQTLQGLNTLVGDPEARIYLKEAVLEARDATRQWKAMAERLNLALFYAESGQGNLGKFIYSDDLYRQVEGFVDDLRAHPWKLLSRPKQTKQPAAGTKQPAR